VAKKFANLTQNILYQVKPGFAINLPLLLFVSAKLELESTYLEGSGVGVRIRSVPENSYLCVNPDGDLTLEVSLLSIVKSSATRFTRPSTPSYLYADNTLLYLFLNAKLLEMPTQALCRSARGGVGETFYVLLETFYFYF